MNRTINQQTCLVIEDEKPLQNAILTKLEKNGLSVLGARSVKEAINHLQEVDRIDIIWLDHYLLGQKDGLEFVVQIKNNPDWKNIPIFVVSNTASPDKIESYLALGVEKYYTKADHRLSEIIKDIKQSTLSKE